MSAAAALLLDFRVVEVWFLVLLSWVALSIRNYTLLVSRTAAAEWEALAAMVSLVMGLSTPPSPSPSSLMSIRPAPGIG